MFVIVVHDGGGTNRVAQPPVEDALAHVTDQKSLQRFLRDSKGPEPNSIYLGQPAAKKR